MNNKLQIFFLSAVFFFSCSTNTAVIGESNTTHAPKYPKNLVLLIGDGMGLSQISAGIYSSKKTLALERFPIVGLQKTHCKNGLITDSAASATAMARGIKADYNTFGSTEKERAPISILEELSELGWKTGITVTSPITHATPAAFFSYQLLRSFNEQIAAELLQTNIDYLVGGGMKYFTERHIDERNLIAEMESMGYDVFNHAEIEVSAINTRSLDKLVYFTADEDPNTHAEGRAYFLPACRKGLSFLEKKSDKGFFYLIEGSQIDWGGHSNLAEVVIDELLEFDEAIKLVLDYAQKDGETLVIVTSDHETGGLSIVSEGEKGEPIIEFSTIAHTATLVPVFAYGPGADLFSGVYDNTEIHYKIRQAMGLNKNDSQ